LATRLNLAGQVHTNPGYGIVRLSKKNEINRFILLF